jgi:hypothetical protein
MVNYAVISCQCAGILNKQKRRLLAWCRGATDRMCVVQGVFVVQGAPCGTSQHIKASCAVWHGADHTPGFQYMETSLHKASEAGWHAVVQTLLEHGADVSAIDEVCFGARAARLSALPTKCQPVCYVCAYACTWWRLHHPGGCTTLRHVPENVEASLAVAQR